jgi:3-oxoacyl-(acyl-carrier-protein) synthase
LVAAFRPGTVAAPCPLPDARTHLATPKLRKLRSDDALLATVAARRAVAAAGLGRGPARPVADDRIAAFVACGIGSAGWRELVPVFRESMDEDGRLSLARLGERGLRRCNPLFAFQVLANMPLCFLSIEESVRGDNLALAPWEGGGARAVEEAAASVRRRASDAAIACGTSAMAGPQGTYWLAERGLLAPPGFVPRPPAPGDARTSGLAPADGAAAVVVERLGDARRRGARPLAAVVGFAQETIPGEAFTPCRDAATIARVVEQALASAGLNPEDVAAVVLSATGDAEGDRAEAEGLAREFHGPLSIAVPARALGALFAAAPLTAVALAAHALADGTPLEPSMRPAEGPPDFPLALRDQGPVHGPVLVGSFGPGGTASAIVLERVSP